MDMENSFIDGEIISTSLDISANLTDLTAKAEVINGDIAEFKQKTEFHFKKNYQERLWHLSYHDHVLRKEESVNDVALYILNNPVRKGMVDDFKKYDYLGSCVFDIKEM